MATANEVIIKMPRETFEGLRAAIKGLGEMLDAAGAKVQEDEIAADQEILPEAETDGPLAGFANELDAASMVR